MKRQNNDTGKKICTRCNELKSFNEFNKDKKGIFGLKSSCKKCISMYSKKYIIDNKQKTLHYNKIYRECNKDKIKIKIQDYQSKNKELLYLKNTKYHFKKYNTDPIFRLKRLLRDRISKTLTNKNITKKTFELLGCDKIYFQQHLESLFLPEMSWENHGDIWEIDHIKPCACFDLTKEEEQKQYFHYSNLQPLFKTSGIAESFGYIDHIGNRNKRKKQHEKTPFRPLR
jgi:hypothetical protein